MSENRAYRLGHNVGKVVFFVLLPLYEGWHRVKWNWRSFWAGFSGL